MKKLHALEFSLTIGCQMDCRYCPQKLLLQKYYGNSPKRAAKLSLENFKKALTQVREGAEISFAGMSEPFANPECADMIVYAHEQGYKISLLTTAVGMRMEDYEKIKGIPFDSFVLHIPDEEMNAKIPITAEYLQVFRLVVNNIKTDYYSCHGTVHPKVADIIDKTKYAGIELANRAGNLDLAEYKPRGRIDGRIVCYHGSEHQVGGWAPVMFPDGTLVLCCMDYGMKHPLGNLLEQSWEEIEKEEEFLKFKRGLDDDREDILCRTCSDSLKVEDLPAMRIRQIVREIQKNPDKAKEYPKVFADLAAAKTVCVYGLGKLFADHFFQEHWNEGLGVSVLSDRNPALHGTKFGRLECVSLQGIRTEGDNAVIILFVKNGADIKAGLQSAGYDLVYSIDEVMSAYEPAKPKKITLSTCQ